LANTKKNRSQLSSQFFENFRRDQSQMKSLLCLIFLFVSFAIAQDVTVDLLNPTTTTEVNAENVPDVDYQESEETTNGSNLTLPDDYTEDNNHPSPDSLIKVPVVILPAPLPNDQRCNLNQNQSLPFPIPPIVNSTIDPIEREIIRLCPIGSIQNGSSCIASYTNECPEGYTYKNEKCVLSRTTCPLNFEFDPNLTRCVQRQICPPNYVLRNGRCVQPEPRCPLGWHWNGERCEVSEIECPAGSVHRGNECVIESFTCPIGFNRINDECIRPEPTCTPGYELQSSGFCTQIHFYCPPGSVMINGECRRTVISCPSGTIKVGDQCYQIPVKPSCPIGYYLLENNCYLLPPDGSVTTPRTERCPPGYYFYGNSCYPIVPPTTTTTTQSPTIPDIPVCPSGTFWYVDRCYPIPPVATTTARPICPEGTIYVNGFCYGTERPPSGTTKRPETTPETPTDFPFPPSNPPDDLSIETTTTRIPPQFTTPFPPFPNNPQPCPDGFTFHNKQCYRCPPNFNLCDSQCVKNAGCGSSNYPNININIFTRDQRENSQRKGYNIINNIEPINNTIVNVNNVTHPVTLNNVNENNIYVYTDAQCPDGSIRTIVVKNNETINGCVDMESESATKISQIEGNDDDEESEEKNEKCCEILTPRQCKKKDETKWICTHRRYKYCGKFCIADRLYLKPPSTRYENNVLTIAPQPPPANWRPCFRHDCPPIGL
jgi:hypothetical protein